MFQVPALGWRKRDVNGNLGSYSWLTYSQVSVSLTLTATAAAVWWCSSSSSSRTREPFTMSDQRIAHTPGVDKLHAAQGKVHQF